MPYFVSSFHPDKIEKKIFGHFILGKFLEYKDVPLHGDIIPESKVIFENSTVDCRQYHNIVSKELLYILFYTFAHLKRPL